MNRRVEKLPEYWKTEDVIVAPYFTSKSNPQANVIGSYSQVDKDCFDYIFGWYVSVLYNDLYAIILHDGLSAEFIKIHQTRKIRFVRVYLGSFSLNDERFYCYQKMLNLKRCGRALFTDISDVTIKNNPFKKMRRHGLLVGGDQGFFDGIKFRQNQWLVNKLNQYVESNPGAVVWSEKLLNFSPVNAGVFGGGIKDLNIFLKKMIDLFEVAQSTGNHNMVVFNASCLICSNFYVDPEIVSDFKKFEVWKSVCVVHK